MELQKVKAIEEDGDWYVLPEDIYDTFINDIATMNCLADTSDEWYEATAQFVNKYEEYRTGGDLNLIQLYAEI